MIQQNNFIEYRDNIFNGVWDASTERFPVTSNSEKKNIEQKGFWLVTVNGTINSIFYTKGDWVYYDGNGNLSKLSVGGSSTAITDNQVVVGTGTGIEGTSGLTYDGTILTIDGNIKADNLITTGYTGRDADNLLSWDVDDILKIIIGGVTHSIVSIINGDANNDKLVTQGYVDDRALAPALHHLTHEIGGTDEIDIDGGVW